MVMLQSPPEDTKLEVLAGINDNREAKIYEKVEKILEVEIND